jgi:hypothetical protein
MRTLIRAAAMLAGIAVVASGLTAGAATVPNAATAPRTSAIAWADCNYGFESLPTPPLMAYLLTPDGLVTRTRSLSTAFKDVQAESAVIGPERFRAVAAGIDRSTLFDPPPKPTPGPDGLIVIGHTITDTRNTRFAVRRGDLWTDWIFYREYTKSERAAVDAAYAAAYDKKLVWHPAAPRANAFAVCDWGAPRYLMTIPRSASTSLWGVSEIVLADCHRGTTSSSASSVYAYRFMRSGNVARTAVTDDASRTPLRTENTDIGLETVKAFGGRLEQAGFFQAQDAAADAVPTAPLVERISALRDDVRTTRSTEGTSPRRNYSEITNAMLAKVSDPGLSWKTGPLDTNAFSICVP